MNKKKYTYAHNNRVISTKAKFIYYCHFQSNENPSRKALKRKIKKKKLYKKKMINSFIEISIYCAT